MQLVDVQAKVERTVEKEREWIPLLTRFSFYCIIIPIRKEKYVKPHTGCMILDLRILL